jgi:hypothetical protein
MSTSCRFIAVRIREGITVVAVLKREAFWDKHSSKIQEDK